MAELFEVTDPAVTREVVAAYGAIAERATLARDVDARFAHEIRRLVPVDRLYAFEQRGPGCAPVLYEAPIPEPGLNAAVDAHSQRHYRSDPVNLAFAAAERPLARALVRADPSDIADASYRSEWFERPGIVQRLSVVKRFGDRWLVMNAARRRRIGPFQPGEIDLLVAVADLVLPLFATRHERSISQPCRAAPLSAEDLEARFSTLSAALTTRERQVCARLCLGMSAEAVALSLDIGQASVVTYRRRAYQRLGVCSAQQLGALVLG